MNEYLHPGVYVEEIERGPRPIEGVPTSSAAFIGAAERGPIHPHLITSYTEYARRFGGAFCTGQFLPDTVRGYFENGGGRLFVCRVVDSTATTAHADLGDFELRAAGPGAWGTRIWAKLTASSMLDGNDVPVGFRLRLAYFAKEVEPFDCFEPENAADPRKPQLVEEYDDLVADPDSPASYERFLCRVERGDDSQASALVTLRKDSAEARRLPGYFNGVLTGGTEGAALTVADFGSVLTTLTLDQFREVALVYAPAVDVATQRAIVEHCEASRFRFAVLDCDDGAVNSTKLSPRSSIADSAFAAFYSPWLEVADPDTGVRRFVPPGGHVLGVYARSDVEQGVFKAPANEVLRGVVGLAHEITDTQQELLNPRGVNAIRNFPGRGIRVWGARTLSSNALWKYVNLRRLFIFLERSIYEGTQWVVFEPNDEALWARVKDTIRLFLRTQWRSGTLLGTKEEEAFFVVCDRSTMTQLDILEGRLICEIGVAPVKPAEFVILRISQNLIG